MDAHRAAGGRQRPRPLRIPERHLEIVRRDVPLLGYVTLFTQRSWPFLALLLGIGAIVIHLLRRIWARPERVRPAAAAPGHVAADV